MRVALAAFLGAAVFTVGVIVGLGSSGESDQEAPMAIVLVDEGSAGNGAAREDQGEQATARKVQHPVDEGEADSSGPGSGDAEYWEDEGDDDNSGPGGGGGSGGDDSSGPGGGGGDNSGPGSSSSGSGSDGSGDSSGSGSGGSGGSGSG